MPDNNQLLNERTYVCGKEGMKEGMNAENWFGTLYYVRKFGLFGKFTVEHLVYAKI
jgi:hypothetical protein